MSPSESPSESLSASPDPLALLFTDSLLHARINNAMNINIYTITRFVFIIIHSFLELGRHLVNIIVQIKTN